MRASSLRTTARVASAALLLGPALVACQLLIGAEDEERRDRPPFGSDAASVDGGGTPDDDGAALGDAPSDAPLPPLACEIPGVREACAAPCAEEVVYRAESTDGGDPPYLWGFSRGGDYLYFLEQRDGKRGALSAQNGHGDDVLVTRVLARPPFTRQVLARTTTGGEHTLVAGRTLWITSFVRRSAWSMDLGCVDRADAGPDGAGCTAVLEGETAQQGAPSTLGDGDGIATAELSGVRFFRSPIGFLPHDQPGEGFGATTSARAGSLLFFLSNRSTTLQAYDLRAARREALPMPLDVDDGGQRLLMAADCEGAWVLGRQRRRVERDGAAVDHAPGPGRNYVVGADGTHLYVGKEDAYGVLRIARSAPQTEERLNQQDVRVWSLAVDDTHVWYADHDTATLKRIRKAR